ncbi:MAG: hypothetical protein DRP91_07300, partial [Candidatus Neomarinimicrobiota bacterium]
MKLFAGDTFYGGGLTSHARYLNDRYYIFGERHWGDGHRGPVIFAHIGGHCHEFGHCIGLPHLADYDEDNYEDKFFALMEVGGMNGPEKNGACPSGINPYYKIARGWVNPDNIHYISSDVYGLEISYDYLNPNYYVINRSGSNKYFILENRLRDGFDYYTPNDPDYPGEPEDPNGNEGGLLIWRVEPTWIHLLLADNEKSDLYPDIEGENRSYSQDPFPLYQGQRVNYNTSPNSRFRDNSDSHYAFQNIVWDDDNKAATVDIYTNAWTGEIEENTTWDGDVFVYGNVTVSPNVELTIVPGVKIKFDSGVRLTVEGKLTAHGTSDNPIVFTSSKSNPSPGSWYGIVVEDGGEIELNHARVEYAAYGVKSSYADVELRNSEFVRNKWGCRLYHSDGAVIDNCVFSDNYYYGALLSYSSNVNIEDSEFKNTSLYHGLYLSKSTVRIADSRIEGNHGDGIKVYNQGNLDMSTMYEKGMEEVNNVISNNGIYGIYISYNSTANLGTYLDIETDILGGFNHFSHISENYDVYNNNTATIKAEVNWWDDMNIFGNMDYTPTAEDLGYHPSKGLANAGEDEKVRELLLEAYRLEYVDSLYAEAIRKLDEVV